MSWIGSLNGPLPLAALPKPAPLLLEKAGRWVLESIEFRSWMCGERTVLLCHGVPGAGKTTLMSIITRYLSGQTVDGLAVGIANIYCESGRHDDQTYCNLLASLLSQLARFGPRLPGSLLRLHEKHKRYQSVPLEDELSKELDIVVAGFSKVFILVDALDECRDDTRTYLLARLRNIQNRYPMNFLATSRHRNALPDFHQCAMLEIRARDEDVRDYLEANMQYLDLDPSFPDLGEKVKTVIIQAIDGM